MQSEEFVELDRGVTTGNSFTLVQFKFLVYCIIVLQLQLLIIILFILSIILLKLFSL